VLWHPHCCVAPNHCASFVWTVISIWYMIKKNHLNQTNHFKIIVQTGGSRRRGVASIRCRDAKFCVSTGTAATDGVDCRDAMHCVSTRPRYLRVRYDYHIHHSCFLYFVYFVNLGGEIFQVTTYHLITKRTKVKRLLFVWIKRRPFA